MSAQIRFHAVVVSILIAAAAGAPTFHGGTPETPARTDQFGNSHELPGAEGQLTLLDFAASWCAPCRKSMPYLTDLAQRYPDLRLIVIDIDEERSDMQRFIEDLQIELPVVWDEGFALSEHYRPEGMPATLLLNAEGEVIYRHIGFSKKGCKSLEQEIETQLAAVAR